MKNAESNEVIKKADYVTYYKDGQFEISVHPEGLPRIEGVIPAPDVWMSSEEKRVEFFDTSVMKIYLSGWYVVSQRRIRNTAFDKKGQKTTMKVIVRPCKTKKEAEFVRDKILEYSRS